MGAIRKITSLSNPKIRETLEIKNKSDRYRERAFIIEGPHLIEMAMASGSLVKKAFFTSSFSAKKEGQRLLREISKKTVEIFEVTDRILNKLTDTETPQGIIAIASYTHRNLREIRFRSVPLIVVIDGVQEPGNLGTIIRTSDAAGADAVIILRGTCDPFMQKTIRATAGSIFNIPVIHAETDKLLKWLASEKIHLIVTDVDAKVSIFDADFKNAVAFVFGNEAHGVSNSMKKNADSILKVPIIGKAESLNVAASAAVCLYEAVRQR